MGRVIFQDVIQGWQVEPRSYRVSCSNHHSTTHNAILTSMPRHSEDEGRRERHSHRHRSRRPRSRSPYPDGHHKRHHRSRSPPPRPVVLPYKAHKLSKHDYEEYKPLFQSYLDIQKKINLDDLGEREIRGRWKSFVRRWYASLSP